MNDPFKSPSKPHVAPTTRVPTAELFPVETPPPQREISLTTVTAVTMTSREIVDLVNAARQHRALQTGKPFRAIRYDNAKRVIDSCVANEVFTFPQIEETSFTGSDGRKQTATAYILDKRSATIVAAQLSPEFTAVIVDRLEELEKQERLHSHLTTEIYRELRYHAAIAERRSVRWVIEHKMVPWAQHKFRLISPAILDPVLNAIKSFLTVYWPDESGEMHLLSKSKPAQSLIERNWTDKEILQHHRFVHKHDPNPPETAEQMLIRLGDRPKAHLLESV